MVTRDWPELPNYPNVHTHKLIPDELLHTCLTLLGIMVLYRTYMLNGAWSSAAVEICLLFAASFCGEQARDESARLNTSINAMVQMIDLQKQLINLRFAATIEAQAPKQTPLPVASPIIAQAAWAGNPGQHATPDAQRAGAQPTIAAQTPKQALLPEQSI